MEANPYLVPIRNVLPRLLALFDADRTSDSLGVGDRYYWAWGLIDFGNGTFQGGAHGMARLWVAGLWPYATDTEKFLERIDELFEGARNLTRADGSLEEAFPHEGSFCVTALVAFDLLCALGLLREQVARETQDRWCEVIRPMTGYLLTANETHAVISNHLATAVAALVRWHQLTKEPASERRAQELLSRIIDHQSEEGWFREYEGADPGYQSLCTYYLADVHHLRPDWGLGERLARSVRFIWHFAHPDGSFGGLYGARCTRLYYPAGFEALADDVPEAAVLAEYMADAIAEARVVTLASMDEPNLVPMFNAYCWAATLWQQQRVSTGLLLPAKRAEESQTVFPEAGLLIDAGIRHYTVISTHKGGVIAHFRDGRLQLNDGGVVLRNARGTLGSSQAFAPENRIELDRRSLTIESVITSMPKSLPTPMRFIILRLLCISAFRARWIREWVKRLLVRLLITRRQSWKARNIRRIQLGADLTVKDELVDGRGCSRVEIPGPFVAIHMASQGYWQMQDEDARP